MSFVGVIFPKSDKLWDTVGIVFLRNKKILDLVNLPSKCHLELDCMSSQLASFRQKKKYSNLRVERVVLLLLVLQLLSQC